MTSARSGTFYRGEDGGIWAQWAADRLTLIEVGSTQSLPLGAVTNLADLRDWEGPVTRVYPTWGETPPAPEFEFGDWVRVVGKPGPWLVVTVEGRETGRPEATYYVKNRAGQICQPSPDEMTPWSDES